MSHLRRSRGSDMEPLVRKLQSLSPLVEDDVTALRDIAARETSVASGTGLIAEGDNPSDVILILSGFACRFKLLKNGRRQIVAFLVPGDFCDLHVFILKSMDHGIATLSPCKIVNIPRASILQLLERPGLSKALLLATLVDEAILREWVTNIGQRHAEERVAHLFCELHVRLRAVGLVEGEAFDVPVTQTELGDTVGLSTVHINRSLQSLREKGLITFKSGKLRILDVGRLQDISGFNPNYLHLAMDDAAPREAEIS